MQRQIEMSYIMGSRVFDQFFSQVENRRKSVVKLPVGIALIREKRKFAVYRLVFNMKPALIQSYEKRRVCLLHFFGKEFLQKVYSLLTPLQPPSDRSERSPLGRCVGALKESDSPRPLAFSFEDIVVFIGYGPAYGVGTYIQSDIIFVHLFPFLLLKFMRLLTYCSDRSIVYLSQMTTI